MSESRLLTNIGKTLRIQRERRGLTQRKLADRAGVSQAAVARIEHGGRAPSLPLLQRIFAVLDLQLTVGVEPLDAHLDARIAELSDLPIEERIAQTSLDRTMDHLDDLPYVLVGCTAALLQGAPVPADAVEIAVAWADADRFTGWLDRAYAQRWHPQWQEFVYVDTDLRRPGDHYWRTRFGELKAVMCDSLPPAIEVRHGGRTYPVVPLPLVEVTDPATADLLRRYRDRLARELAGSDGNEVSPDGNEVSPEGNEVSPG